MEKEKLFAQIKGGLIVSCQALEHEPLYTKEGGVMPLMAKAAAMSGAVGIRANTVRDITQIKQVVDLPVIGIIKKDYPGTPMYITVTMKEVDELVACGVDILAVQGTGALRPDGSTSAQFIRAIKAKYPEQLVMADCDNFENAMLCAEAGADFVGTTMRGYTPETTGIDDIDGKNHCRGSYPLPGTGGQGTGSRCFCTGGGRCHHPPGRDHRTLYRCHQRRKKITQGSACYETLSWYRHRRHSRQAGHRGRSRHGAGES